jgi:hypothetical protein
MVCLLFDLFIITIKSEICHISNPVKGSIEKGNAIKNNAKNPILKPAINIINPRTIRPIYMT